VKVVLEEKSNRMGTHACAVVFAPGMRVVLFVGLGAMLLGFVGQAFCALLLTLLR
jgi:hypothetical protein